MEKTSICRDYERKRLEALHHLKILDTPNEDAYDTITKAVKQMFDVPIALISLTDADRQWFKSNQGMGFSQADRSISFTPHAILKNDFFIVPDAQKDERFAKSPLVTGEPGIRFYASYPLHSKDGYCLGALCIIDTKPRNMTRAKLEQLKNFAQLIEKEFFTKRLVNSHLKEIAKIQELYIRNADKNKLFNYILKVLLESTNSEYGFIGGVQIDNNGNKYLKTYAITNIAWDKETRDFYTLNAPEGLEFTRLDTLFGYTVKTGELVISNNPSSDSRASGLPKGHPELKSYLGAPIYGQAGMIAMYGIANRPGGYDMQVVENLKTITNTMTAIIESTRNFAVIDEMAKKDPLTPTYNRHHFRTKIESHIEQDTATPFCLMMMDFDEFKTINDYYGHLVGDQLLIEFSKRIKPLLEDNDFIARIGGDEFTLVLHHINSSQKAAKFAEKLTKISQKPYLIESKKIFCSISIGVVFYPSTGKTFGDLMRRADFALYRAKTNPQQFQFYSDELEILFNDNKSLEKDLLVSLKEKQFYLIYQPQINIKNNTVYGFETLVRWRHPQGKNISPDVFIPAIRRLGMSEALNIYVVEMLANQLATLPEPKIKLRVAANISPHVQNFSEHVSYLIKIINKKQLHKNIKIEFEITEESFMASSMNSPEKLSDILHKLTQSGISLAIDDFGIEHSSISRLVEYKFSTIKIDSSFIQKLNQPTTAITTKAVIGAITYLAKKLKFNVVAEGVETEEQVEILRDINCEIMQGYYYHKPMHWQQAIKLI